MAADDPDLNLLAALDVLLEEASVTAAARRLGLSVSAMSRTLTRLRAVTGDARQEAALGPASVAVHDQGDMARSCRTRAGKRRGGRGRHRVTRPLSGLIRLRPA